MIIRYKISLPQPLPHFRQEWAYPLYSFLMNHADAVFSTAAHLDRTTPVSQYLRKTDSGMLWIVSLLGKDSINALDFMLNTQSEFFLDKDRLPLIVTGRERQVVDSTDDLLKKKTSQSTECVHRLVFHTPTAFKSRGEYVCFPTVRQIMQSLLRKWNACMETDVRFPEEETEKLAEGLICRRFDLCDRLYRIKGNPIPGFCGEMTLINQLDGELREHAELLLSFAGYSGVGIKTALGMGGVEAE